MSELLREPGFYWVRVNLRGNITVAEFDPISDWWMPGNECDFPDDELTVLSERLVPPE